MKNVYTGHLKYFHSRVLPIALLALVSLESLSFFSFAILFESVSYIYYVVLVSDLVAIELVEWGITSNRDVHRLPQNDLNIYTKQK